MALTLPLLAGAWLALSFGLRWWRRGRREEIPTYDAALLVARVHAVRGLALLALGLALLAVLLADGHGAWAAGASAPLLVGTGRVVVAWRLVSYAGWWRRRAVSS